MFWAEALEALLYIFVCRTSLNAFTFNNREMIPPSDKMLWDSAK
jgi:hypothetical protein